MVVNVPFTNQAGAKPRPALVVSVEAFHGKPPDVIVCPVSSQPLWYERPGPGDCPLQHWERVGLRHPSTARLSNLLSVEKKLLDRKLGALHPEDLARVVRGLREAFGL